MFRGAILAPGTLLVRELPEDGLGGIHRVLEHVSADCRPYDFLDGEVLRTGSLTKQFVLQLR